MLISLIAAMDNERGIARDGAVPWHLPADLKRFKMITMGHHLVMGRKTFETIGRALPGRTSIVVTRQEKSLLAAFSDRFKKNLNIKEISSESGSTLHEIEKEKTVFIAHSLEQALAFADSRRENETFIIGGGEIYAQSMEYADQIYLTIVHATFDCDVFFPDLNPLKWVEVERVSIQSDPGNPFDTEFIRYQKIS